MLVKVNQDYLDLFLTFGKYDTTTGYTKQVFGN